MQRKLSNSVGLHKKICIGFLRGFNFVGFRPSFMLLSCAAQSFIVLSLAISCKFHVIGSCYLRLNLMDRLYKNGDERVDNVDDGWKNGKCRVGPNMCAKSIREYF